MLVDLVLVGLAAGSAAMAYLFKRQAGMLILFAMAGALCAETGAAALADWLTAHGVKVTTMPLAAVVGIGMILLPPAVGFIGVSKTSAKLRRLIGSILFGIVVGALLVKFTSAIFADTLVNQAKTDNLAMSFKGWILAGGLLFALADIYLAKMHSRGDVKK